MDKNALVLAYIGDAIYEVMIREYLIDKGICKVKELQSESIKYVSAKAQAKFLRSMQDNNFLKEDEIKIVMNARNHKSNHKPKNTDIITYKNATGLEALFGFLYLSGQEERLRELSNKIDL